MSVFLIVNLLCLTNICRLKKFVPEKLGEAGLVALTSPNNDLWEAVAHLTGHPSTYLMMRTISYAAVNLNEMVRKVN